MKGVCLRVSRNTGTIPTTTIVSAGNAAASIQLTPTDGDLGVFLGLAQTSLFTPGLVAHVTFMLLNSLIGLAFMPFALKGLRQVKASTTHRGVPDPTVAPDSPTL